MPCSRRGRWRSQSSRSAPLHRCAKRATSRVRRSQCASRRGYRVVERRPGADLVSARGSCPALGAGAGDPRARVPRRCIGAQSERRPACDGLSALRVEATVSLSGALERIWYPREDHAPPSARALAIPELAFRAGVAVRNALYDRGALRSVRVGGARVISVGNLTVGGSGKTPAVIHLATLLSAAGRRVFVLSRGSGRGSRPTFIFRAEDAPSWEDAGDEPLLIARRCPGVTLV